MNFDKKEWQRKWKAREVALELSANCKSCLHVNDCPDRYWLKMPYCHNYKEEK